MLSIMISSPPGASKLSGFTFYFFFFFLSHGIFSTVCNVKQSATYSHQTREKLYIKVLPSLCCVCVSRQWCNAKLIGNLSDFCSLSLLYFFTLVMPIEYPISPKFCLLSNSGEIVLLILLNLWNIHVKFTWDSLKSSNISLMLGIKVSLFFFCSIPHKSWPLISKWKSKKHSLTICSSKIMYC